MTSNPLNARRFYYTKEDWVRNAADFLRNSNGVHKNKTLSPPPVKKPRHAPKEALSFHAHSFPPFCYVCHEPLIKKFSQDAEEWVFVDVVRHSRKNVLLHSECQSAGRVIEID